MAESSSCQEGQVKVVLMPTVRVALVQFDAQPGASARNLEKMSEWVLEAGRHDARWIMFHEGTVTDYVPKLARCAESVPGGTSTRVIGELAKEQDCCISFGLSENSGEKYFMSQVFVGPAGLVHVYRKSWLWRDPSDRGYRNEWARYDPGAGPESFQLDGVGATCFICSDGEAPRCIERARRLKPEVVFYPNNRGSLPEFQVLGRLAQEIGAPMLVTNRIGVSGIRDCKGGCVIYSANGRVLAKSNRAGREELLIHDLEV